MIDRAGVVETGRALGVDHGTRRIGIAVTDPLRLFARPLLTFETASLPDPAEHIAHLALEWGATDVVVGVPLMPAGETGEQAAIVLEFLETLRAALERIAPGVTLCTIDESDSTVMAESRRPARAGKKRRASDAGVDAYAAAVILETWLRDA